ncbi:MAG: methionyl-tRNA formyltransferase [Candidatus Omnitrophota bacterium]
MRVVYFGNNRVGYEIFKWLLPQVDIVGLIIHSDARAKYSKEIIREFKLHDNAIFKAEELASSDTIDKIKALNADIGVCVFFGDIIKEPLLSSFSRGIINIHPSYLPYNRGCYANVWSIVDDTPAGATIHEITPALDKGPIWCQKKVHKELTDTGKTLYEKCEQACIELFKDNWDAIAHAKIKPFNQAHADMTYHKLSDIQNIDQIDLQRQYTGSELINILRARTFAPHKGAYFMDGEKKIYMRIQLDEEKT